MRRRGEGTASRAGCALLGVLLSLALPLAPAHATDGPAPWWYEAMKIGEAHREVTGDGVTVAVFDSRLDPSLPGLAGADISVQENCYGHRQRRLDPTRDDHGASVVGLIVGQDAPGSGGVVGIAPDTRILFYPQDTEESAPGEDVFLECTGWHTADQVDAAVRAGADILSFSTAENAQPDPMTEAVRRAIDAGVVVVGAAGNNTQMWYPAAQPGVVSAYAVDRSAGSWSGNATIPRGETERGFPVISAPGVDVPALRHVDGRWQPQEPTTGTSLAAPIVAGALALVKEKYPEASGHQLVQHLVHDTGGTRTYRWDRAHGFGIVSVEEMLLRTPAGWPDANPLLRGPRRAVADFPPGSYREPTAAAEETTSGRSADSPAAGGSAGLPGWLAGAGVLAMVAAAAGGIVLLRRGPGGTDQTSAERV